MRLGTRGDRGSGKGGGRDAADGESRKLPHENSSMADDCGAGNYRGFLNRRLLQTLEDRDFIFEGR
jgi:hypothetical protein